MRHVRKLEITFALALTGAAGCGQDKGVDCFLFPPVEENLECKPLQGPDGDPDNEPCPLAYACIVPHWTDEYSCQPITGNCFITTCQGLLKHCLEKEDKSLDICKLQVINLRAEGGCLDSCESIKEACEEKGNDPAVCEAQVLSALQEGTCNYDQPPEEDPTDGFMPNPDLTGNLSEDTTIEPPSQTDVTGQPEGTTTGPNSTGDMAESTSTTDAEGSSTGSDLEDMVCTQSSGPTCYCWSKYDPDQPTHLEFLCHDECVDTMGSGNAEQVACKDDAACCAMYDGATCNSHGYCVEPDNKNEMHFLLWLSQCLGLSIRPPLSINVIDPTELQQLPNFSLLSG